MKQKPPSHTRFGIRAKTQQRQHLNVGRPDAWVPASSCQPHLTKPPRDLRAFKIICSCGMLFSKYACTQVSLLGFLMAKAAFQVPPIPFMETSQVPCSEPPSTASIHATNALPWARPLGPSTLTLSRQSSKPPSKMRGCIQRSTGRIVPQPWLPDSLGAGHQA